MQLQFSDPPPVSLYVVCWSVPMSRKRMLRFGLFAVLVSTQGPAAFADVKPHALIADGMVLQQGVKVPIWGSADDEEKVTVHFQDQEISTVAKGGTWLVRLDELKAGGPYEMTITGKNRIQFRNILIGEVWVCSGQSNMEWPVQVTAHADKAIADSANPMIRLFTVARTAAAFPLDHVQGKWQECGPDTVKSFSAVGYFFGRDVQKARNVPVGLIHSSWGGTPAEAWTSKAALEAEPALKYLSQRQTSALAAYPGVIDKYIARLGKYEEAFSKAVAKDQDPPNPPVLPVPPSRNPNGASTLYNGMIAPIIPYAMRGAIWYQGESNAGRAYEYRTLLPTMIKNWRTDWKQGNFPFLIVQLAPFMKIETEPGESQWAELREAQLLTTLTVPNTALAVITDVGEENDIHPRRKEPVGARLALAARALAYGEKIAYSGPVHHAMRTEGNKAILSFEHTGSGLAAKGGPLTGFTLAGKDRKFVKAQAEIHGDKVAVWSPTVDEPVAVRYGWTNYPVVNLWNKEGLPASPFRTDDFPMLTRPKRPVAAQ
jgi:sialate O-acetylesterase